MRGRSGGVRVCVASAPGLRREPGTEATVCGSHHQEESE